MTMIPATSLVVLLSAILTALGDFQRPIQGYPIGLGPDSGVDIIFPLTITQCEPVLIYYNTSNVGFFAYLDAPDNSRILNLWFPAGVGYLDWICDIPWGYSFRVVNYQFQYYTVQPGSSSACLGDITTTYEYADYSTAYFQSYTQNSPSGNPDWSGNHQPTINFPTGPFPTITANPGLAVIPITTTSAASAPLSFPITRTTTSAALPPLSSTVTPATTGSAASSLLSSPLTTTTGSAASSPPLSSPLAVAPTITRSAVSPPLSSPSTASSVSSHRSNTPVIAGGVVGGIAFILLTITIIFVFRRKRRNMFSDSLLKSATPYLTSQLGPPLLPSTDADSRNAMRRSGKFNIHRTTVPDTSRRDHVPTDEPRYPGANLASTLDVARPTVSQRQPLMASLNAFSNPATSPTPADAIQHEAAQEDLPGIANILGFVSQLTPESRNALVTSFHNLLMMNQATPADLTSGTAPSLPPYAE